MSADIRSSIDAVMQMASGYVVSSCLNLVTRLQIAEQLDDGPKSSADLAKATGVMEDLLYRVLRALSMVGVFAQNEPRLFSNTPASALLSAKHPNSLRDMVLWVTDHLHFELYSDMMPVLRDGKTAVEHKFHCPPFEVLLADPDRAQRFQNAMSNVSARVIPAVLEAYDFSGIDTLADIAGGHGFVITAILQKYSPMKGILFDLEQVIQGARERIHQLGLQDRVQIVSGDFFDDVPPADAYLMKSIIHDWDDERATTILRNCAKHLNAGGKVILIENVISPGSEPQMAKMLDIQMMMMAGGRERTDSEFRQLLSGAGLELTHIFPTRTAMSVIESKKL